MKNQKIAWFLVIFSPFILYLIMNLDIEINNIIISGSEVKVNPFRLIIISSVGILKIKAEAIT